MRQLPLSVKAYATLTGGNGTASIGPLSPGEWWSNLTVAVSVATNVAEATAQVYSGAAPTPGNFCDATTWGSTGDSTSNVRPVRVGGQIWAVWTGGDAGQLATMTITGTRNVA